MDTKIVAVFCLCDDMLKALNHLQDPQCQMTDAEVMTTAIIAAMLLRENFEHTRLHLLDGGYIPGMLSKSRFNKIVETTGSMIEHLLPKSIHSVTAQGFELKVGLFVLAASPNSLW